MILGRLATLGWAPTKAVNHVFNLGYGFRRQEMFRTYHLSRSLVRLRPLVEGFGIDDKPLKSIMTQTDFKRPRKYRIHAMENYYNTDLGKWEEKRISWYTDKSLTKRGWSEDYLADEDEEEKYPHEKDRSISVINIEHNRTYAY